MSRSTRRTGFIRRLALGALATAAALTGTVAVTGQPAEAVTYGRVTACFQAGISYGTLTVWGPARYSTVYVDYYAGSRFVRSVATSTNVDGCVSANVPTGYIWTIEMDHWTYANGTRYHYVGFSNLAYVAGPYNYGLGTSRVSSYAVR